MSGVGVVGCNGVGGGCERLVVRTRRTARRVLRVRLSAREVGRCVPREVIAYVKVSCV